jgi:hypothetical protein
MASKDEAADFERRNTDPTIPIDGADPVNMAGPLSNVELEIGDRKRSASLTGATAESTRLRPEFAKQAAKTGDAITDADVLANPAAGLNVGEDNGTGERQERDEAVGAAGLTSTPARESGDKNETASDKAGSATPRKSTPAAKDK